MIGWMRSQLNGSDSLHCIPNLSTNLLLFIIWYHSGFFFFLFCCYISDVSLLWPLAWLASMCILAMCEWWDVAKKFFCYIVGEHGAKLQLYTLHESVKLPLRRLSKERIEFEMLAVFNPLSLAWCTASMPHALFVFNAFFCVVVAVVDTFFSYFPPRIYVGFNAMVFFFFCSWLRSLPDTKMCSFSIAHFFSPSNVIGLFSFWFRLNDYNARWRHVWVTVFAIDAKCNNS